MRAAVRTLVDLVFASAYVHDLHHTAATKGCVCGAPVRSGIGPAYAPGKVVMRADGGHSADIPIIMSSYRAIIVDASTKHVEV